MSAVNVLAIVGLVVMATAAIVTKIKVTRPNERRIMYLLIGGSAALIAADRAIIWYTESGGQLDIAGLLTWLLYVGGGLAVAVGVGAALRNGGATRFAWRQGRYQKYRQYRRI